MNPAKILFPFFLSVAACGGAIAPDPSAPPDVPATDAGDAGTTVARCRPPVSAGATLACGVTDVEAGTGVSCNCPESCAIVSHGIAVEGTCVTSAAK